MTKIIVALVLFIGGVIVFGFGISLGMLGIRYFIEGIYLFITSGGEVGTLFTWSSVGLWLVFMAVATLSIETKVLEFVWEKFDYEKD